MNRVLLQDRGPRVGSVVRIALGAPAVLVTMLLFSIWGKKPEATAASSTDAGNDRDT